MSIITRGGVIEWLKARKDGNPYVESTIDEIVEWVNSTTEQALTAKRFTAPAGVLILGTDEDITIDRDVLGKAVRDEWVRYCKEIGDTKPTHVAPWEELGKIDQEADRRIGEYITRLALASLYEPMRRYFEMQLRLERAVWESQHDVAAKESESGA